MNTFNMISAVVEERMREESVEERSPVGVSILS